MTRQARVRTSRTRGEISTIREIAIRMRRATETAAADIADVEAFPVGSVYFATVATSPSTLLGYGTWTLLGSGMITLT
jgi:hypothetical protein